MTLIKFEAYLEPLKGCTHGPQTWPWWRLFGFLLCEIGMNKPSTGKRLWIYLRGIGGIHFDLIFDRRENARMKKKL